MDILIIHPYDRTTFFLQRIKNHILSNLTGNVHYFSVKPNDESHNECIKKIKDHPDSGLIIFLGHGRTTKLYGSKSDKSTAIISEEARAESPADYYNNEDFITLDNVNVFSGKKIFCLACNSNDKISDYAIQNAAVTFLGFGDIPTSNGEFGEKGNLASNKLIKEMKTEINYIIKKSLVYCLQKESTFDTLLDTISFITNQRIVDILKNRNGFKERYVLADSLYFFKKEIRIKGNKNALLTES